MYPHHLPTPEQPDRYEFRANDMLNNMLLERHSDGADKSQVVEIEIEVTPRDCDNMLAMKNEADDIAGRAEKKYLNTRSRRAAKRILDDVRPGRRFTYRWTGQPEQSDGAAGIFLEYLQDFEMDRLLRAEFELAPLSTPMIYLPVNRFMIGFNSSVELASYNEYELKLSNDALISRSSGSIVPMAIGRLALKFRLLLEKDSGTARRDFDSDANMQELTSSLRELGYEWELVSTNLAKNRYDIRLKKQGLSFNVGAASSGEREILTYLFAIFALNVSDALIVVDEPELHLHPSWQKLLLRLFVNLAKSTGNQFLLATHSPTFVSPDSIQFVSRVFSREQRSHVLRMASAGLPEARHLLNIVNSQNNERIFFADAVVLVEGLSDRIFFEAVLDKLGRATIFQSTLEVISVGGKGLFDAYGKLLDACGVPFSIVADRDYIEEIGTNEVKSLFKLDEDEIKRDVIDNPKSYDGATLVARIDEAIAPGTWEDAQNSWKYIKSRRRRLRDDLDGDERAILDSFIMEKRTERIYLLKKGALEAYLPDGYRTKDIGKLIAFLAKDFWPVLSADARDELSQIGSGLMPPSTR
jgi:putative ATP-dependent endonuclease of OLD family